MQQRSTEWYEARCGKFTASCFSKLIGKDITATAHTYILEKIVETTYGYTEGITTEAMQWGIDFEEPAAGFYRLLTGDKVESCGFIEKSFYGGSPDGLIGDSGLIEIKCPFNPINHLRIGLCSTVSELKAIPRTGKDYYWQCIGNMLVTGRKWCDFVSYDPRLQGEASMYILRIEKDEKAENELIKALNRAKIYRDGLVKKLGL